MIDAGNASWNAKKRAGSVKPSAKRLAVSGKSSAKTTDTGLNFAQLHTEVIVHWRKFTYVGHGIVAVLKLAAKKGVQPEMKERYSALKEAEGELRDALAKSELYSTLKMHIMSIDARTSASNFRRSVSETDTALIKSQDASDNLAETIANLDKCNKEQVEFARAIKNELETPNGTY